MKTLFTVGTEPQPGNTLLLEVGVDDCCYAFVDQPKKAFTFIRYLSVEDPADEALSFLDNWDHETPQQVIVCSAYAQALLVPQKFFREPSSLTAAVYDLHGHHERSDRIDEWQMRAAYALPGRVHEKLLARFPGAIFFHAYTPALKAHSGLAAADQISLHFTTQHFRVLVKKDNQVQLAQTYAYKVPLDVAYFLLKICYEFGLKQSEVFLFVSGLIDEDSALYEEMHHYFLNLHVAPAPGYDLPESSYPHYYFTSLYNLAACVS